MNRKLTAVAIVVAAVFTNAAFTALGQVFNYPDVLKEPSRVVLERFHEHQGSVSFWFTVLALSAALFAPISIGVGKLRSDHYMRVAMPIGIAAAVVQVIGLSRWPLLVPGFASDAINGSTAATDHFDTTSTILGTVIGETFGYLLTAAWTLLVVRSLGAQFAGRVFAGLGAVSAAMIFVGVVSPLDIGAIDTINFGGYVLWSVWLIWFAVVLLRSRADRGEGARARCAWSRRRSTTSSGADSHRLVASPGSASNSTRSPLSLSKVARHAPSVTPTQVGSPG